MAWYQNPTLFECGGKRGTSRARSAKTAPFGRMRSVCAETHSEKIQKDRNRELQKQKEDRYGELSSSLELSLRWSSMDEEQPALVSGRRGESEGEPHHG